MIAFSILSLNSGIVAINQGGTAKDKPLAPEARGFFIPGIPEVGNVLPDTGRSEET